MSKAFLKWYRPILDGEEDNQPADRPQEGETLSVIKEVDPQTGFPVFKDTQGNRLFTQDHMNKEIGKARQKAGEKNQELITQLEEMKKNKNNSSELQEELQSQIDALKAANLTEKQQAEVEIKRLSNQLSKTEKRLTDETDQWRGRFEEERIHGDIIRAAEASNAVSSEQIYAFLRGITKLAEERGEDGKSTGNYVALVEFDDVDENQNPVKLQLSVEKAVARMREQTDRFGNLFRSEQSGGIGSSTMLDHQGGNGKPDFKNMSYEQYEKWAKANPTAVGAQRR